MTKLPHNLDAEEALLGAMLLSVKAIEAADEVLTNGSAFYSKPNGLLYDAIKEMAGQGDPVDPITVSAFLGERVVMVGGGARLVALQAAAPVVSNARHYAEVVMDAATARSYAAAGQEIASLFAEVPHDVEAARTQAAALLERAETLRAEDDSLFHIGESADEILTELLDRLDGKPPPFGLSLGLVDLDELLGPIEPGSLVLVGARPGMGKTVLGCRIARHVAMTLGLPVGFASLEMPRKQITERIIAGEARIAAKRLKRRLITEAEWDRLTPAVSRLHAAPIEILDKTQVGAATLRAAARRVKRKHGGLALFVVDYVQLMVGGGSEESRRVEVDQISRSLKTLARDEGCVVVALAQLNRSVDNRSDKRPLLGDLRESGSLEADADVVIFPYRDAVYHPDTQDVDIMELIVAKNRHGETGTAKVAWLGQFQTVADMARAA